MGVWTYICIAIISFVTSLSTFFISLKQQKKYAEVIAIPVLSIIGLLFGGEDPFEFRIRIIALIFAFYGGFYIILHILKFIITKINSKETDTTKKEGCCIKLPISTSINVGNDFIEDIPANVTELLHFSNEATELTREFIATFPQEKEDNAKAELLKSYFLGLCYHLSAMFDNSTRVHVRIQTSGSYQKYVATFAAKQYDDNMKIMSLDNKMIAESFSRKCSLIKSLNPELHENGSNKKWKNYLMFSVPQILHENRPVFTFGISITRKSSQMFYFLNYCEIEAIVGDCIQTIVKDKDCNIVDFIYRTHYHTKDNQYSLCSYNN